MNNFYSVKDVDDVGRLVDQAISLKMDQRISPTGKGKTLVLLFFNSSLRTRLSTQKAAYELGMNVITMNVSDGWKLELENGAIMNLDKAEHIKDAARVVSQYADIIGIRAFPGLQHREEDYKDRILRSFMEFASVPIINLESAIRHPCQSLADFITINEHKIKKNNKIVVTWAPHPKALPQAVVNSFLEWAGAANCDITVTHPPGYELSDEFMGNYPIEYNQNKALANADFVYVKNWSSYTKYGQILHQDPSWMITQTKMELTNNAKVMHCLPVRRNVVISDDVLDSENSLIYIQADNRTHAVKSVLKNLIESPPVR